MAITQLKTKIRLRYDSYAAWMASNPVLLPGEVAVVVVNRDVNAAHGENSGNPETVNENSYKPTILFKVGDGNTVFDQLPWASGLAADVYAWAKKAQAETGDNMLVTGLSATPGEGHVNISNKNGTTLNSVIQTIFDNFNELTGGNGSINEQVNAGLANLVNTAANASSGTVSVNDSTENYITGLTISTDGNGVKRLTLTEGTLPTVAAPNADATAVTPGGNTTVDVITNVSQTKGAISATKKTLSFGDAAQKTVATNAIADDNTDTNLVTAQQVATYVKNRATEYETKVDTLIDNDDNKSVRTIANEELAAQLIPANAQESLDTLQEIAAWIQDHPDDASAMNDAITALKTHAGLVDNGASRLTKTVDVEGTPTVQQATVKEYVDEKAGDLADDLTALTSRVAAAEGDIDTLEGRMDTAEGDIDALEGRMDDVEADIAAMDYTVAAGAPVSATDAAFTNVLTGFEVADGKLVTNSATTQTLAKVATTGAIEDLIQTGNFMILNGGNAAGTYSA